MFKSLFYILPMATMWGSLMRRTGVAAFRPVSNVHRSLAALQLQMSTTASSSTGIVPRVKTVDATSPSEGPVLVKGWVRTVRKQKTLAFVEVNDGSNLSGIQCVLSFDAIDDATQEGS
jgi:hypothetical protein